MSETKCIHYGYQDSVPVKECDGNVCNKDCPNYKREHHCLGPEDELDSDGHFKGMKPDATVVDDMVEAVDGRPISSLPPVKDKLPPPKMKLPKEDEPITPKGYGELKVGMEGKLNGVPVKIRKITKKDIILRPLNRAIRDEHGLMVSFEESKGGL